MKKFPPHKKPDPIYLTQEAMDKARADKKRLDKEQAEILIRVQTAREMGDLSENGAYKYAKFELGKVRRQLKHVNNLLRHGVVKKSSGSGVIEFGSKVTLESNGKQHEYIIVSHHESDPMQKKISEDSPLGKILTGKKAGETATLHAPIGEIKYMIISVE